MPNVCLVMSLENKRSESKNCIDSIEISWKILSYGDYRTNLEIIIRYTSSNICLKCGSILVPKKYFSPMK